MHRYFCVLIGGGAGSLSRYLLVKAIAQRFISAHFAWGTLLVNITGSFAIGLLMTLLLERFHLPDYWRLTLVVGFLGGYTTFSSFEYDAYLAVRGNHQLSALFYVLGSVAIGYLAVWFGALLVPKH